MDSKPRFMSNLRSSRAVRPLRILCATADPAQRRTLLGVLAGPGRTVECVRDGQQALACVALRGACDVVFATHALPGLGGLALVRRLRRAGFDGRVVVLCASASAALIAGYHALGVTTLLLAPAPAALLRAAATADAF